MSRTLRSLPLPVSLTLALVVLLVVLPGRREPIVHLYVLALSSLLLFHLVRTVRGTLPPSGPSRFDATLRRRPRREERLPELERVEREVALGMGTAFDLHYRLRPTLRRTASELLASRRAIDLDAQPEAARHALGDEAWEIVRGDREPPRDRYAPGVQLASLRQIVASLEAL